MNTQTLPFEMNRANIQNHSASDARWEAVLSRDASRDGEFVYAVRSTRVYCRPGCPSRRPRREQVQFFRSPEAAKSAGYRACLRCRPDDPGTGAKNSAQEKIVARVCEAIGQHDEGVPNLERLASSAGVSPHSLLRIFRKKMGITPRQYADAVRLSKLKSGLQKGSDVTTAMYDAGYGSSSRLYEQAGAQLGMTPSTYRHGGRGMHISYTIENCALGKLLVGATERGISAVYLGDRDRALQKALRKEYPHANLQRDDSSLGKWVRPVVANIGGANQSLDLPIDVQATALQRRVWEELRKIPRGQTRSYGEIAAAIGRPAATRAVASACATNRLAIVVPCHRVVRRGGTISGYRWGVQRKRALLEQEKRTGAAAAARISAD